MECSCEFECNLDDYGDPIECHSAKIVRARKEHRCNECFCIAIKPGDEYEHAKFLADGRWFDHKTCGNCLALRSAFTPRGYFYENIRNDISEHINECRGELPESCIAELPPEAMAWVCDEIEKTWED